MGCETTPGAKFINSTYESLTGGVGIPNHEWHVHQGKGTATPDEAVNAARNMCRALGVSDPDTDPRTSEFIEQIATMKITEKQKWVMEKAGTIRENTNLDSLGRIIERRTNYSGYRMSDPAQVLQELESIGVTPDHPKVVFEHVTYAFPDPEPAPPVGKARIVAVASNDAVQALVVEIDGSRDRPDGGTYHITLSLADGHKPKESNDLLASGEGIRELAKPIDFTVNEF